MKGTIKKLLTAKRCGFITGEDGEDYFFHASAVKNAQFEELHEGQEVIEFVEGETEKGPRAERVHV